MGDGARPRDHVRVDTGLDHADAALAAALAAPRDRATLTLAELAEASGVGDPVLEALEREGLLAATPTPEGPRYTPDDLDAVRAGLSLLEAGLPLGELLDLARRFDDALRGVTDHAVELFLEFVRDPIKGTTGDDAQAAERLVAAFDAMLPATGRLVGHYVQRLLVDAAQERVSGPSTGGGGAG